MRYASECRAESLPFVFFHEMTPDVSGRSWRAAEFDAIIDSRGSHFSSAAGQSNASKSDRRLDQCTASHPRGAIQPPGMERVESGQSACAKSGERAEIQTADVRDDTGRSREENRRHAQQNRVEARRRLKEIGPLGLTRSMLFRRHLSVIAPVPLKEAGVIRHTSVSVPLVRIVRIRCCMII